MRRRFCLAHQVRPIAIVRRHRPVRRTTVVAAAAAVAVPLHQPQRAIPHPATLTLRPSTKSPSA